MIKDSRIVNFVIYLIKTIKDILIEEKWYIFKMLFFYISGRYANWFVLKMEYRLLNSPFTKLKIYVIFHPYLCGKQTDLLMVNTMSWTNLNLL